jgi:hypothetical protein
MAPKAKPPYVRRSAGKQPQPERRPRTTILTTGEAHVDRFDVGEVAPLHDALFNQSLEDAATAATADAQLVSQRHHGFRYPRRRIDKVAYASLVRSECLLTFDGSNPQQIHIASTGAQFVTENRLNCADNSGTTTGVMPVTIWSLTLRLRYLPDRNHCLTPSLSTMHGHTDVAQEVNS